MYNRSNQQQRNQYRAAKKMPPPSQKPNGQQSGPFNRQNSLAIAASLQEADRDRSVVDFMETELDLDNYLACFNELDVSPLDVDFNDRELQKAHILYDDGISCPENNAFGESSYDTGEPIFTDMKPYMREQPQNLLLMNQDIRVSHTPPPPVMSLMNSSNPQCDLDRQRLEDEEIQRKNFEARSEARRKGLPPRQRKRPAQFDREYAAEWGDGSSTNSSESEMDDEEEEEVKPTPQKRGRKSLNKAMDFKPETRARKYNLKPETEKSQPVYKIKRARNNDAVRKSRNKAKELQKKRDEEYDHMKKKIQELQGLLEAERKARTEDRKLIEDLLGRKEY